MEPEAATGLHLVALAGWEGTTCGVENFRYSGPKRQKGEEGWTWTEANLRPYLRNPREVVAGTARAYPACLLL